MEFDEMRLPLLTTPDEHEYDAEFGRRAFEGRFRFDFDEEFLVLLLLFLSVAGEREEVAGEDKTGEDIGEGECEGEGDE